MSDEVQRVWGGLLRNEKTGAWRAKIWFTPPLHGPILGPVFASREDAAADLCRLMEQWMEDEEYEPVPIVAAGPSN